MKQLFHLDLSFLSSLNHDYPLHYNYVYIAQHKALTEQFTSLIAN